MALDFTTSLIKLNNQYTIVGTADDVEPTTVPKKGELYFGPVQNGTRACYIGDGETEFQALPQMSIAAAGVNLGTVKTGGDVTISNGVITVKDNSHNHTIAANATDGMFDLTGTGGTNSVTYAVAPYSSRQSSPAGTFDNVSTNPSGDKRLNYNGYLYATKLYSGGSLVCPQSHSSTTTTYGAASTSQYGHVKLSSATDSDSEALAATPKAVKLAYNLAQEAKTAAEAASGGIASSAIKLASSDGTDISAGSGTQPVYFANGVPKATTYSLNKSVPSDAKFTDTTYSVAKYNSLGLLKPAYTSTGAASLTTTAGSNTTTPTIASKTTTSGRYYGVEADKNGVLFVNVPWTDTTTATKLGSTTKGSVSKPIYLSSGTATECSTYAGGTAVTLNGSSKSANTASFYAPTSAGTSGYILQSNGSGAPTWVNANKFPKIFTSTSTEQPAFPTGSNYGATFSSKPISNTTANNDNYMLHVNYRGELYVGYQTSSQAGQMTKPSWKMVSLDGHTHSYLPLSGGTLTGKLTLPSSLYCSAGGGIDCNNSDLVSLNGLYFRDEANSVGEGINFLRSDSAEKNHLWDRLWGAEGVLYWTLGETIGSSTQGTTYKVMTSQHISFNTTTKVLTITL